MCIVPKLCYILQVSRFKQKVIDSLQAPLLALTKNKMGLARTINNSIILHRSIGNCNALWDNLLTKQISSLHLRLNTSGPEEILTLLRIIDGMEMIGATENTWHKDPPAACARIWKNNLACRTMLNARELGILLKFRSTILTSENKDFRLASILKESFTASVARSLRKLNLISLKQLLTSTGDHLITWQQLKILRNNSSRGKKAKWFQEIEKRVLEEEERRTVKEDFKTKDLNTWMLQAALDPIENDRRKKEWLLTRDTKNKENRNPVIRKTLEKRKKSRS